MERIRPIDIPIIPVGKAPSMLNLFKVACSSPVLSAVWGALGKGLCNASFELLGDAGRDGEYFALPLGLVANLVPVLQDFIGEGPSLPPTSLGSCSSSAPTCCPPWRPEDNCDGKYGVLGETADGCDRFDREFERKI